MRHNGLMTIDPAALAEWVNIRNSKRDFDVSAIHADYTRQQEEQAKKENKNLKQSEFGIYDGGRIQGEFRSRAIVAGETAVIPVHNSIDYRPSIWSDYGYLSSSLAIRTDFARLVADDTVKRIVLDIDSPGGLYTGTPELARDIYNARDKKDVVAVANPLAASGALWIGAAASKFYALGSGQVGSIGALILHSDWSQFYTSMGITNTILRSPAGKADFNSMEPISEEVRAHYQKHVEAIADEFQTSVGKFRGKTKKYVADNFGGGRMLTAEQAVSAGLIDGIVDSLEAVLGPKVKAGKRVKLSARLEIARLSGLKRKGATT